MAPEELHGLPSYPAAVADWEDLLVRLEIMPRALRTALEQTSARDADPAGTLERLVACEIEAGRWLEVAAFGSAVEPGGSPPPSPDPRWLADRFAAVRARNFAMVQRRGVDVWEWTGELGGTVVTVYQLLSALVRADAETLAALREGRPIARGVTAC